MGADTDGDDDTPPEKAPVAASDDQPTPVTIACGCRRTLKDNAITSEPRYGFWRSMTLLFGITAAPVRMDFVCMACGKTVGATQDPDVLRKNTH